MKKKTTALILSLMMILTMLPTVTTAINTEDNGPLTITECNCVNLCTEESIDSNCPLCSSPDITLSETCKGKVQEVCKCINLCSEESIDSNCPLCSSPDVTLSETCKGKVQEVCNCVNLCSEENIDSSCSLCSSPDVTLSDTCKGKVQEVCNCVNLCSEENIDINCPVCTNSKGNLSALCLGTAPITSSPSTPKNTGITLYVGNTPITEAGFYTSNNDGLSWQEAPDPAPTSNYIHYDGTNTLTLNGVTIKHDSTIYKNAGIYIKSDSDIDFTIKIDRYVSQSSVDGINAESINGKVDLSFITGYTILYVKNNINISAKTDANITFTESHLDIINNTIYIEAGTDSSSNIKIDNSIIKPKKIHYNNNSNNHLIVNNSFFMIKDKIIGNPKEDYSNSFIGIKNDLTVHGNYTFPKMDIIEIFDSQILTIPQNSKLEVYSLDNNKGNVNIEKNGTLITNGNLRNVGIININGGTLISNGNLYNGFTSISLGTININDGTLESNGNLYNGYNDQENPTASNCTININGGTLLTKGSIANNNSDGCKIHNNNGTTKGLIANILPFFTTTSLPNGVVNKPYSQTVDVENYNSLAISDGSLPTGLSLDENTGTISGTPTAANDYTFDITATNNNGSHTKSFSVTINPALVYSISIDKDKIDFGSLQSGYTQPNAETVTITNKGNTNITLKQPKGTNYEITPLSDNDLAPSETATFTIRPNDNLPTGNYDEEIIINGSNDASAKLNVKFTVTSPPSSGGTSYSYYNIDVSSSEGGSISYSGSLSVRERQDKTFIITPDEGYVIYDVIVDGKSVGKVSTYTFEDVRSSHSIKAIFVKKEDVSSFVDVSSDDWFFDHVIYVCDKGLMKGFEGNVFAPYSNVTRAQLAVILYELSGRPEIKSSNTFVDTQDMASSFWYYDQIAWAQENGIFTGYEDGSFRPDENLSREQLAAVFYSFSKYMNLDTDVLEDISHFADRENISPWSEKSVRWAVAAGLMNGDEKSMFNPKSPATRGEIAAMLHNFAVKYGL